MTLEKSEAKSYSDVVPEASVTVGEVEKAIHTSSPFRPKSLSTLAVLWKVFREFISAERERLQRRAFQSWLAEQFGILEDGGCPVNRVYLCAKTYRRFRGEFSSDLFDPITEQEVLKQGYLGDIWGAQVWLDNSVPLGVVRLETSGEYLG